MNKSKIVIVVCASVAISVISIIISISVMLRNNNNNENNKKEALGDTNILYDSSNVSYDNETSGINSNNVQDAIDELYGDATDYSSILTRITALEDYKNQIYPVGSIYISVDSTNPSTLFGGTWVAFGTGKTLVGIDTNDTDFDTVEETGGAKSVTIETANLPSHTHTVTAAGSVGAHTHTVTAKGSVSSTFSGSSTNTSSSGSHSHKLNNDGSNQGFWVKRFDSGGSTQGIGGTGSDGRVSRSDTASAGAHTHTVTAKGTVSSSFTGQSTNTGSATPTFTGSSTNTSAVGSATPTAVNTKDPYITVYMWKRTA